ncbi:hypothetical protein K2W90_06010 [Candidatus Babeliales bacterium]|nr:hypothetical protein [Candidatus Babeliales bacterium]
MFKKMYLALFFVSTPANLLNAEIIKTTIKVDKVTCSYCVTSLQKAFAQLKHKDLKSIESRNVDVEQKQLTINLHGGNALKLADIETLYESTIDNANYKFGGITHLEAVGSIKHGDFGYYFNVDGSNDKIYLLEPLTTEQETIAPAKKKWWQRLMFWKSNTETKETATTDPIKNKIKHLANTRSLLRISAPVHRHPDETYGVSNYHHLKIFVA